jgi:HlyD family secretion protein
MLFILFILFVVFIGCSSGEPDQRVAALKAPEKVPDKTEFSIQKVSVKEMTDTVSAVGMAQAYQEVDVSPEITGKIIKIYCDVGDSVLQGKVLAEIDDESRVISLEKKRALLSKAEATKNKVNKDIHKSSRLFKEGVISDSESDDIILEQQIADAELTLARAEVRAAEKELQDTKITAPFDGKIASKNIEIGMLVTPNQTIFTVVDIQKVKIIVHVSEMDIAKIAVGNTAKVIVDSLGGENFQGRVATIGLKADDSTRTFTVEIVVGNEQEKLLSGMVARVGITSAISKKIILIPQEAIRSVNGMKAVHLMDNGRVIQRIIYPGEAIGDQVIIEKGLTDGDTLILSDVSNLNSSLQP